MREADFFKLLNVATIESSLRSLLVLDATEKKLLELAYQWAQIIVIAHNAPDLNAPDSTNILILNSATTEENLWGKFVVREGVKQTSDRDNPDINLEIIWKFSKLVEQEDNKRLVVVIPDLTRLSLPATRACVALLDSEWATLQRDGMDVTWQPHFFCLAGCQRDCLGEISPHLLDRFALRSKPPQLGARLEQLSALERFQLFASDCDLEIQTELPAIALELANRSREILANEPVLLMSDQAIERVQAYFIEKPALGMRRLLTLARLARGLASLEREETVSVASVDHAARLLGIGQNLSLPIMQSEIALPKALTEPKSNQAEPAKSNPSNTPVNNQEREEREAQIEQVVKPDVEIMFPVARVVESGTEQIENLYFEDDDQCISMRELEPLKLPIASARPPRAGFGHPIGTQPATNLEDISLFGTFLEAAKFQSYRRSLAQLPRERHDFQVWVSDLRSYRRMPMPQYQLICAIDFTCLQDRLWQDALVPHLRDWAYVNRASICIIRIGAKGASEPLRSHLVTAKNLLAPEVFPSLEGESGTATPLAHGLELAGRTAKASLQHGRNQVVRVRLVVLTDGRGNIPLQASLDGVLNYPVSHEGVDDALAAAKGLAEISRLEIVLLDPQPLFHADLPDRLAKALGAVVEKVEIKSPSLSEIDSRETLEPISLGEGWR